MAFGELVKSLIVRFTTDGAEETKLEIDDIGEKVYHLTNDKHNIKIGIDDGGLTAKLAAMDVEVSGFADRMKHKLSDIGGSAGSMWTRMFSGLTNLLSNAPWWSGGPVLAGGAAAGSGIGGTGILGAIGGPVGLGAAAVVIIQIVDEIGAIATGLVAAGAGLGAFAALAIPTFSTIFGAVSQIATDTTAYDNATTKAAKNDALKKIKADWAALDPAQRQAVHGIQNLQTAFDNMAQKMEPVFMKLLGIGLQIAQKVMPFLLPLAQAAGKAIIPLAEGLDKFVSSKGFAQFMSELTKVSGPAITAIGDGIGKIAISVGKLMEAFLKHPKLITDSLTGILDGIAGLIQGLAWFFREWNDLWSKALPPLRHFVDHFVSSFRQLISNIHQYYDIFEQIIGVNIGHVLGVAWNYFTRFLRDLDGWIRTAENWFRTLPNNVIGHLETLVTGLFALGQRAMQGLLSGLKSMVGGIISQAESWGKSILNAIGGPFGIHFNSPPSEAAYVIMAGHRIGEGLAKGMLSSTSLVTAASHALYSAAGWSGTNMTGAGYGAGGVHVTVNFNGVVGDPNAVARQIQQLLLRLARDRGYKPNTSAGLGLA